ncbi:MAG: hypothetical protein ACTHXB_07220 [Luteimonas sp.]
MTTRLSDIVEPAVFTEYVVENTAEKSALVQAGVMVRNAHVQAQLTAGADQFTVPNWRDLGNDEADIVTDDPDVESTPGKVAAARVLVRKAFLAKSWGAMNFASELSGSDALVQIQRRVTAYWERQLQRRLVASLNGILASNIANDDGDMVHGDGSANFSAAGVIDAAHTLGDSLRDVTAIGMHSDTYANAMKADLIATLPDSQGGFIQTFRGLGIVVDDGMPVDTSGDTPVYTSILFGPGAVGYGIVPPRIADGTAIEQKEASGNGGGQQVLHSRNNLAIHPGGFSWVEDTVASESPSIAELAVADNWSRVYERKNIPLAFLRHGLA